MKIFKTTALIIIALLALTAISIPLINNLRAYQVKKELMSIPLPEKTEIVEAVSKAGKLSGNGNGMQYFGAVLIRSDLSLEELEAYYKKYAKDMWKGPFVKKPKGQIFNIGNSSVNFSTYIDSEKYYMIHLWDFNESELLDLDIRGH